MKQLAKLYDIVVLATAFVLVAFAQHFWRNGVTLAGFMALRIALANGLLFGLLLLLWHELFTLLGLYDSKRLTPRRTEIYEVCKATLLAALVLFVFAKAFHISAMTPTFVVSLWAICAIAMISGRLLARFLLIALRKRGKNGRFVLIVGTNERALEFAEKLRNQPELGYHIVGFVDDHWGGTQHFEKTGYVSCCTFEGLAQFLRHNVVDEAAIYLPLRSYYEHAAQLVSLCQEHGIAIRTDPRIFTPRSRELAPAVDEDDAIVAVAAPVKALPAAIKRCIDVISSAVLLFLLAPLLLVVAVLVKLSSDGPILFRQTRVGLNKRNFTIYKFRTMIVNAEKEQSLLLSRNEMTGPVFKIKEDPRVTRLGKALRKTSIDELPQLFNVLKGQMSLVGPRAMSLRDYQLFDRDCHRRRFSVKPGITCLWQVCGRNTIPFEQWMELDLQYIDKWSLWLDLKILARTVPAVLRGEGAV